MKKVDESLKDNRTKIKQNKQLPWLVSNIVEILDIEPELDDDGQIDRAQPISRENLSENH